jgi:phosphate transport system substrate-binding protein
MVVLTAALAAGLSALTGAAKAQELTGAGATFPAPIYQRWFQEYGQAHGVQINYQAIGSGGGIKAITPTRWTSARPMPR